TLIEAGGQKQVVHWDTDGLKAVDLETGKSLWSVELPPYSGMGIMAPQQSGEYLFVGSMMNKAVLLKLAADRPAVTEVWRGRAGRAVYPVNSTPLIQDGVIYGVDQPGQLRAVKLETGERLWETAQPTTGARPAGTGTAFLTRNGDRYFLFSETGDLIIARLS